MQTQRDQSEDGPGSFSFQSPGLFAWVDTKLVSVASVCTVVVVVFGLIQVSFGAYSMTILESWESLFHPIQTAATGVVTGRVPVDTAVLEFPTFIESNAELVVWNIRLPRIILAVLVGMNLAVSGAIFQAVTRNEMASPFVLGVNNGAGVAILLTLVFFPTLADWLPISASIGGGLAFLVVYLIAWNGGTNPVRLVLAGVIVSAILGSVSNAMFFFTDQVGVIQNALAWLTGSITGTDWGQVQMAAPWTLLSVILALVGSRQLNILLLGEETASSLGMNVEITRFALSVIAIIAASASVAVGGIIGFVGLIVPHIARTIVGNDHKRLLVAAIFVGPALMMVADVIARLLLNPVQLPVGIITGIVGGIYFLYLMRKKRKLGEI
ncbi:ABC-type Fe3+-siderophore transport system, permease component [Halanaeroarchaeum sp. HSR-CO]|uniref:FecCD family ABC transporter permease n=1 Tax=Halanaeroarchaeum sp. HSR-CO TaxID=2866382 RepID=UPI00217D02F3|nr:iron ABC transporter permease [Halanaeroarchaeum sp. HSR-CO]UWG48507.1 ABC-type Fe3+-siderophore transport system, permease component [Halanaeroarchaeum sp. HSR-CO]